MRSATVAILFALFAASASAAVLEVPVPGLTGHYFRESRQVTVHLPVVPSVIHGVSIRIRGTSTRSSWSCDGSAGYGPPKPVDVQFEGGFSGAEPGWWLFSGLLGTEGAIDLTRPFEALASFDTPRIAPTWNFLLDGVADVGVGFSGEPAIMECNQVGPDESTQIDEVTLLVDGEFPTPAAITSWGRLKSIYR
jgi:hypothetical protein